MSKTEIEFLSIFRLVYKFQLLNINKHNISINTFHISIFVFF